MQKYLWNLDFPQKSKSQSQTTQKQTMNSVAMVDTIEDFNDCQINWRHKCHRVNRVILTVNWSVASLNQFLQPGIVRPINDKVVSKTQLLASRSTVMDRSLKHLNENHSTVAKLPNQHLKLCHCRIFIAPAIQYVLTWKLAWDDLRGVVDKSCWSDFQYLTKKIFGYEDS